MVVYDLPHANMNRRIIQMVIKRLLDIVLASCLIVLGLPLFAVLAILIRLDSPGPVLFCQLRVGRGGRLFKAWKFRTMVVDAEKILDEMLANNPDARMEYEMFHKLRRDPRITRVGRWLRRYSVDEIPQLFNVIKGEMSLVGPRAYLQDELDRISDDAKTIILSVPPGLTGIWQVSGRNEIPFCERVRLEEEYVRTWSIWLDICILVRTIRAVISGHGAY